MRDSLKSEEKGENLPYHVKAHLQVLCFQVVNGGESQRICNIPMSEVFVDGENVIFEGEIPSSPEAVYDLLMNALSEQGRAVTGFLVDGENALGSDQVPESYERIDVASLSHRELTLQVIREFLDKMDNLGDELRAYAKNILTIGWSEVFQRMEEFIAKIKPFADLLDNLHPYAKTYSPPWQEGLEKLAQEQADCLEQVLGHFESGNVAGLSDAVASTFAPLSERSRKFLREEAIPELEKEPVESA